MGTEILAHIVVPLMAGVVFLLFVAATEAEPIAWKNCIDIGLDLTLLGLGATGAIFVNPTLVQHWGTKAAIYGILVVLSDLILAGALVYIRRFRTQPVVPWQGFRDLSFGILTIVIALSVMYFGLKS
jgi:hypothetical protein